MRKFVLTVVLTICLATAAQADLYTFTFDGGSPSVDDTGSDTAISNYMTGVYGSTVTVTDAEVRDNYYWDDNDGPQWPGKGDWWNSSSTDNYIRSDDGSDFEILFVDDPIVSASGDGWVSNNVNGNDFWVYGYDASYGSVENPSGSALIDSFIYNIYNNTNPFTWNISFSSPVSLLVIGGTRTEYAHMDNLMVDSYVPPPPPPPPVPVPGAVLLGIIGLSAAGVKLRKFA